MRNLKWKETAVVAGGSYRLVPTCYVCEQEHNRAEVDPHTSNQEFVKEYQAESKHPDEVLIPDFWQNYLSSVKKWVK